MWTLRQSWGMAAFRANGRLLAGSMRLVGGTGAARFADGFGDSVTCGLENAKHLFELVQTSVSFGQILSLSFPLVHNLSLAKQNLSLAKQNLSLAKHNLSLAKHNLSLECHNLSLHEFQQVFGVFQTTGGLAGSSRWWQGGVRECGRGFVGRREDGERAGGLEGGDELAGDDGADQGGEAEADWASWTLSLLASAWARHTDTRVIDLSMMLVAGGG